MKFDDDIVLCTECDAEFTVHKLDDEEGDVEFCPYCGHHLWQEHDDDEEENIDGVHFND